MQPLEGASSAHPCFNADAHKKYGRVHLPVAPRCNVQCKFCDRKYDCVNESRPGVTSAVLTPLQAALWMEVVMEAKPHIRVAGIAGPGDPFANSNETMETLRLIKKRWPELIPCLSTNGLGLPPHIDELVSMGVRHVTITVLAVDPDISSQLYRWIRPGKFTMPIGQAAQTLFDAQAGAVRQLKAHGVTVKINTVVVPGVNDEHVEEVAKWAAKNGADVMNLIPCHPSDGSDLAGLVPPSGARIKELQKIVEKHLPVMVHCRRCRADAVGALGEPQDDALMAQMREISTLPEDEIQRRLAEYDAKRGRETAPPPADSRESKPYVAVASLSGTRVDQHLGEAMRFLVYGKPNGKIEIMDARSAPEPGGGGARWEQLADILSDCRAVLVAGAGKTPQEVLAAKGIVVRITEGPIDFEVASLIS